MKRYPDCQREDGKCNLCSLSSYGKDCHMAPANKIAYLRKKANITQVEIAKQMGVAQTWMTKLERGEVSAENITLKKAIALADALGVNVKELL